MLPVRIQVICNLPSSAQVLLASSDAQPWRGESGKSLINHVLYPHPFTIYIPNTYSRKNLSCVFNKYIALIIVSICKIYHLVIKQVVYLQITDN